MMATKEVIIIAELRGLKKTIVYSNENEKKFIEGALKILTTIEKKSASAVWEEMINKALLPENINAKKICKELYSGEINTIKALEKIFDIYASGIRNEARYQNGYELVEYLHSEIALIFLKGEKESEAERQFFCSNFFQIYKKIEKECAVDNEEDMLICESPVKYVKFHLDKAVNAFEDFNPINLIDIIKKHWDILRNYTYTYRTLEALCRLISSKKMDNPESKLKLIELISKLSKEWN